ncbi:MAG: NYN domain-containing protein [Azonexus sp.]|nr:NYN domain-containing protein [Azonexus sp.]
MAAPTDNASMALFCDFENVALGVRDAQYEKFDIRPVLERLLAKGSIVVKKAYCDWDRYKAFKSGMHEANFELIEIPHVRQSGKNSADIRLVVDALDLCYTKSHVDTFVIISGDSDFSPLVSKLRENAKRVIGVGVKQSCSDLLIANCDEFIYYDDLVRDREAERNNVSRRENREPAPRRTPEEEKNRREKLDARKTKAVELVAATFDDISADRGEQERIWASVLKEVVKRRNPGFNESYFGFRSFGNLLEEAANRGLLGFGRDEKSGAYVTRAQPRGGLNDAESRSVADESFGETTAAVAPMLTATTTEANAGPRVDGEKGAKSEVPGNAASSSRRRGRRTRKDADGKGAVQGNETASPEAPVPLAGLALLPDTKIESETKLAPKSASDASLESAPAKPPRRAPRQPRPKKVVATQLPVE